MRRAGGYKGQFTFSAEKKINPRRLADWEQGADIKLTNINKLCNALGISLKEFFEFGFDRDLE